MAISKSEARDLVRDIAKSHGHLDEAVYSEMSSSARLKVEEALLMKDQLIGSTVITLAKNLYSKDVRFIFELLQNADDNSFSKSLSASEDPYVTFRVFRDKIVVDCNEDGFTHMNLKAICNVGQSSKLGAQGYIGEKGIGFKSVFKVAWKVWIQSGPFSFSFKHRRGESGMGMISPVSQETTEELAGPLTRMTFYLADDGDPTARAEQRKNISEQLNELRPEMLLFLKNLRRIDVRFYDDTGNETSSSVLSTDRSSVEPHRAVLQTAKTEKGKPPWEETQHYHVTTTKATGLAPNENRDYSDQEHKRKAYSTADMILAFPLTDQDMPMVQPQQLFAFLPIRRVGFNFLVHSDFVTMANREDIVTSSLRNRGLCQQLANAFIVAVEQMCEHPRLRFKWMAFLPSLTGTPSDDPFWSMFVDRLKELIVDAPVMVPRAIPSHLRPMRQVRHPASGLLDRQGAPLFDDLPWSQAIYLSSDYRTEDLNTLLEFGLAVISWGDVLLRAGADLRSTSSRMRSPDTDSDWHSRVASFFLQAFGNTSLGWAVPQLKALALIPLNHGDWVSMPAQKTPFSGKTISTPKFPTTSEGLVIPQGIRPVIGFGQPGAWCSEVLGLRLIEPEAASHPKRTELFLALGCEVLSSDQVRDLILSHYRNNHETSLLESIGLLNFLYLTHPKKAPADVYHQVKLLDTSEELAGPSQDDMYFKDDSASYGPGKLGLTVRYVHPDYLQDPPNQSGSGTQRTESWKQWLLQSVGIRKRLRLARNDASGRPSLTQEVLYVAEHLPDKFLGLLHSLWPHEDHQITSNSNLIRQLREIEVRTESQGKICLGNSILPLPRLQQLSARYLEDGEDLPFLVLEETLADENLRGWEFLDAFDIIRTDNLDFYLSMINAVAESTDADRIQRPSRVLDLYNAVYMLCTNSDNPLQAMATVQNFFTEAAYLFLPIGRGRGDPDLADAIWCEPLECFLGAPLDLECTYPLDAIYEAVFNGEDVKLKLVLTFFSEILQIDRCDWRAFARELEYLKDDESANVEMIQKQYERIRDMVKNASEIEELREYFENGSLIFALDNLGEEAQWLTMDDCIWSTATDLRGKMNLAEKYPSLEDFFVQTLGVQRLNLGMLYDELLSIQPHDTTIPKIKAHLWTFNSLLATETLAEKQTPLRLLEKPILPVRYPDDQVRLRGADTEFAIVDHKSLGLKFRDKVKTLDFTDRDVRMLQPFLQWAGLEDRYISRTAREVAALGSGPLTPVTEIRYDISKKAHGLLRIAKHFNSPHLSRDGQEFYDLLRSSETWETDGVSSQLSLTMDGESVTVELEQGEVYIDCSPNAPLKFYIPHDEQAQDECIQSTFPKKLVQWLITKPGAKTPQVIDPAATNAVKGLLNAKLASVARILDKEGIVDVDIPNFDIEEEETRIVASAAEQPQAPRDGSPSASSITLLDVFTPEPSEPDNIRWGQDTPLTDPFSTPGQSPPRSRTPVSGGYFSGTYRTPGPRRETAQSAGLYRKLLDHVVQAARSLRFPSQGGFDMSSLRDALPGSVASAALAQSLSSSDFSTFEIGAAGELFVFELLSKLNPPLPNFSHDNWTSGIRTLVNTHQDYATMERWAGRYETSDLEYNDHNGAFTSILIENGHLPSNPWQGRYPKYHIEVKSTPGELETPFYMSGVQYNKMKTLSAAEDTVYIIFRVFGLYTDKIDLRLFVNPPELERQGKLEFSAEKYTVRVL